MRMMSAISTVLLASAVMAADVPSPEVQIAAALLPAPAELRDGAAVIGYNAQGEVVTLRAGKNELVCLASNPANTRFSVACYHKDLEPYMARGRELAAQKITGDKSHEVRWKEIAEGKLSMPREPRTLYVMTGTGFDAASGKITNGYLRWVIYVPYATPESTGLSTKAADNAPWLMYPGKAGAHIMINPPKK
jgi:hypothetical protein